MTSRREKDPLTPYKICVALLIEKYGTLRPKFWGSDSGLYKICLKNIFKGFLILISSLFINKYQ